MAQWSGFVPGEPQQHRKNPTPTVREDQGKGVVRIAHGEPHDPCPVDGCTGELRFAHR